MIKRSYRFWDVKRNCYAPDDDFWITYKGEWATHLCSKYADYKGDDIIPEQSTGLRDKNGREIYEGDIVRYWYDLGPAGEYEGVAEVYIGTYEIGPIKEWNYTERRSGGDNWLPEIIGNIHENKELLKGANT